MDFTEGFALYSLASLGAVDRAGYGEAVRLHNALGSDNVEAHNLMLASQLREELGKIDGVSFTGPTAGSTASAITTFAIHNWSGGWNAVTFNKALWEQYHVVARNVAGPDGVRLCTAAFNNANDVEAVIMAIRALVASR